MWSRVMPSSAAIAVWLISSDYLPQLMQISTDGSGVDPCHLPSKGLADAPFESVLGRCRRFSLLDCSACDHHDTTKPIDEQEIYGVAALVLELSSDMDNCRRLDGETLLSLTVYDQSIRKRPWSALTAKA